MSNIFTQTTSDESTLEQSYMTLLEFLMLAKQRVITIGAKNSLTAMQVTTLLMLEQSRPMNSFKRIFNCDASNITGIIDGLEEKGLVQRCEDPKDRRIKIVELLNAGKALRKDIMHQLTTADDYLLASLTDEEAATFIALVHKITFGKLADLHALERSKA